VIEEEEGVEEAFEHVSVPYVDTPKYMPGKVQTLPGKPSMTSTSTYKTAVSTTKTITKQ
jgi:hypothetical protein